MHPSVQKKDSKPKSKENEATIDKILAHDFKKDLNTPKRENAGLLSTNLHPPPKKPEKQSYTLAQIIQNSKNDGHKPSGLSETHSSKFFMYGGNIGQSKSKDRLINPPLVQSKDFKQMHGLKTSELKPPKNSQIPIPPSHDKNAKRMTMFYSKELTTPTDRSNSKGPPVQKHEIEEQVTSSITRPPKRRQTDIMETKKLPNQYMRAATKEENKHLDNGYNLVNSEKHKSNKIVSTNNTLTKPRDASPSSYYQKSENQLPSKLKPKPKEDILVLYDHDLNFLKPEMSKMITLPFVEEKLEDFDTSDPVLANNAFKLMKAKTIFGSREISKNID